MKLFDAIGIGSETLDRVAAVWEATDADLASLVKAGELDPRTDFRHRDLRGWPLGGQDVCGFDFTGSDLRSTGFETAVTDATTVLVDATLDPSARRRKVARTAVGMPRENRARRAVPPDGSYTKVRIPNFSDAELIDRKFVIGDPLALENVTHGAPPHDQWITYEARYEVGTMVSCSFAHRHKRGYVFRDEQDRRYLIGHECGAKHFGLGHWQSFTAGRERMEERATYLRLIRDLAGILHAHRDWIAGLPKDPAVQAFDALMGELRTVHPGLTAAAKSVISRHEGTLSALVHVRDFAAEERRREREQEAKDWYDHLDAYERSKFHADGRRLKVDRSPLMKRENVALGPLRGKALFSTLSPLGLSMREVLPLVDAFLTMPRTPTTRHELLGVMRNAKELVTRIVRVRDAVLDAIGFFDQDNLDRVAQWADALRLDGERFEAKPGRIEMERIEGGQRRFLARPTNLLPLTDAPFDLVGSSVNTVSSLAERSRRRGGNHVRSLT